MNCVSQFQGKLGRFQGRSFRKFPDCRIDNPANEFTVST